MYDTTSTTVKRAYARLQSLAIPAMMVRLYAPLGNYMEPRIHKPRTYDFFCLVRSASSREGERELFSTLKRVIEQGGGELSGGRDVSFPGPEGMASAPHLQTRRLAYPIRHETTASVVAFEFQGPPRMPEELREALKHNPHILRYLLTQKVRRPRKHPKPKASPLRTFRDASAGAPEARGVPLMDPPRAPSPETVREPVPQLSPEDIDRKIEEIIG